MIARRFVTVLATLMAVPGLGACAAPATEARRGAPAPAAAATTASVRAAAREVRPVVRQDTAVRNVPAAFPLPPGSHVTDLADRESGASFTLTAPDPEAVLSFYRRQLPQGSFTIVADRAAAGTTSLSFRDADGWAGAIFATARRVTVAVKRA